MKIQAILPALLAAVLLAGCLGPAAAPADEPTPPDGSAPGSPVQPSDPGEPPRDASVAVEGLRSLEGLDCAYYVFTSVGSSEPLQSRAPDGFVVSKSGVAAYILVLHHCRALVLNDATIEEDAWVGFGYTLVDPPGDEDLNETHYFLAEPFTDWAVLREAWARDGVGVPETAFAREEGPAGAAYSLSTGGLSYAYRVLEGENHETGGGVQELRFHGGNGSAVYDLVRVEQEAPLLTRAAVALAEGGVLGEMMPASAAVTHSYGINSFAMKAVDEKTKR